MTSYLISYDLNAPGKSYTNLYKELESFPTHIHPLESTWIINTNISAKSIYQKLSIHMDSNDKIFIVKLGSDWHALLTQSDYDWLFKFVAK